MAFALLNKQDIISNFIGEDCYLFALKHYGKTYANILNNKLDAVTKEIIKEYIHAKDKRTDVEYAKDLILNWIIEDYIFLNLKDINGAIIKNGKDRNRKLLKGGELTHDSDYLIKTSKGDKNIELIVNFTDFWHQTEKCHLRENKLKKLIEQSKIRDTYILAVSLLTNEYQIIKINKDMKYRYIKEHKAFGYKSAYEIDLKRANFVTLKFKKVS